MELQFPIMGLDRGWSNYNQPAQTSPRINNVRPYDVINKRARGGQRPALRKLYTQQVGGASARIDCMCQLAVANAVV